MNGYGYNGFNFWNTAPAAQPQPMPQFAQPFQAPQMQQMQQMQQMPPRTNKIFVTSLEEAMARQAEPNTEIRYFHQNDKLVYDIFTDTQGRKFPKTYRLVPVEDCAENTEYVTRKEFDEWREKVQGLMPQEVAHE